MKTLYVSSGNNEAGISPIIKNQGDSLVKTFPDLSIEYFTIIGKGFFGYLKNIIPLRRKLKSKTYTIVHAHYSLSAILATLSGATHLIVSLMGSDVKAKKWFRFVLWFFYKFFWKITIVKSIDMKESLGFKKAEIIPNGVDMEKFMPMDKNQCQKELAWEEKNIHLLFVANPNRYEKNFQLTENAFKQSLKVYSNLELHCLIDIPNEQIPFYLNAADVVILSSLWEGSPNVIKEAMACNRPIVATNVGDIEWLFGYEKGHYLVDFDVNDVANKITEAIKFSIKNRNTKGRQRIIDHKLDSKQVANKIIKIYQIVSIKQ